MGGPHGKTSADCGKPDTTISGDTVKFHMRCGGAHPSDIQGEVTYGPNAYSGHTVIDAESPQGKMHMINDFTAKRLGDC
jgi:hypothetical protein